MQIKWTDLALEDLEQIEIHIAEDNSPSIAIDVVLRIFNSAENILPEFPEAGRLGQVKGTRELVIDSLPFIVIYAYRSQGPIEILRVLHDAQEWHDKIDV